jgi:hypothetical protein
MPGSADHAVRVDAVDPDPVGGEQSHLMGLVGLVPAVGGVVRPGEHACL